MFEVTDDGSAIGIVKGIDVDMAVGHCTGVVTVAEAFVPEVEVFLILRARGRNTAKEMATGSHIIVNVLGWSVDTDVKVTEVRGTG